MGIPYFEGGGGGGGGPASGFANVANLAALAALSTATYKAATVRTLPACQPWFFDPASTLTADGITVIAAAGGGRWIRELGAPDPKSLAQAAWFVGGAGASDENSGATALLPLATMGELNRRWGQGGILATGGVNPQCVVTIRADLPATDPIRPNVTLGDSQGLVYLSVPVASHTDTVSACVNQVPSTNTLSTITGTLILDFTPFIGSRVTFNDGLGDISQAWIVDVQAAGAIAVLSTPYKTPIANNGLSAANQEAGGLGTLNIGDTFTIDVLKKVSLDNAVFWAATDNSAANPYIAFVDLEIQEPVGPSSNPAFNNCITNISGCQIDSGFTPENSGLLQAMACSFTFGASFQADGNSVWLQGCVFTGSDGCNVGGGSIILDGGTLFYGAAGFSQSAGGVGIAGAAAINTTSSAAFDVTGGQFSSVSGLVVNEPQLWGNGNANIGLLFRNGVPIRLTAPFGGVQPASVLNVTGAGGDFQFGIAGTTTSRAWDEVAGAYTAPIANTWANLKATIAAGGMGGNAQNLSEGLVILIDTEVP